MLFDECRAFARDENDIGCNPKLKMVINLKDNIPVQRAYTSIPKALLREVKEYVQDLLVKGWIVKSKSSFAAPIVCVWKKDGSLHLCIDYRLLNQKTVLGRHPLFRICDLLDTLGVGSPGSVSLTKVRPTTKGWWMKAPAISPPSLRLGAYTNG